MLVMIQMTMVMVILMVMRGRMLIENIRKWMHLLIDHRNSRYWRCLYSLFSLLCIVCLLSELFCILIMLHCIGYGHAIFYQCLCLLFSILLYHVGILLTNWSDNHKNCHSL
jgi:hypothetical protein